VSSSAKKLIMGPSWIGDMIMAQSLYKFLVSRNPEIEIHVVAPPWSIPVLKRMPEVGRAFELPVAHGEAGLGKRWALGRSLRREGYQQAIVLPRSLKPSLIPFFASVPVRTGFSNQWRAGLINDERPLDTEYLNQTVKRYVFLGLDGGEGQLPSIPKPQLDIDTYNLSATAERLNISLEAEIVALIPGAEYGPAKRWPAAYYAELASRLVGVGLQVWILGSEKERELGDVVSASANHPNVINLCGKTSLVDVIDLLSIAKVAVTNDTGLLHVAAAVKTHVIGIYGSSSPEFTPPLTRTKDVFYLGLGCSPCFSRECPLGHFRCMREILVDEICSSVITVLGGPGNSGDGKSMKNNLDQQGPISSEARNG
jgi:heptosyltransferase-2